MINPPLQVNKMFIEQVEKCLRANFHPNTMEYIRDLMRNKDTCVIALIIFNGTKTKNPKTMYRFSSCVFYSIIENCVCIFYLFFQYKK